MGRPLSDKFFGNPANAGYQLPVSSCWIDGEMGANATSYIVKQLGTRTYIVHNSMTGNEGIVKLQATSVVAAGQAVINVTPFSGPVEHARTIQAHNVKTWEDHTYRWNADNSVTGPGEASLGLS